MSSAVDLIFLSGPLEGTRVELDPKETLRLGRKRGGLDLEDPLVSMEHATIAYQGDAYWITDLNSASGTAVNGRELGEAAVKLKVGDRVRIGDGEFALEERPLQNMLRMVLIVCILLASMPIVYQAIQWQPLNYDPVVKLRESVVGGNGTHDKLVVPRGFVRREGVDHRRLRHTRTTDIDGDGIQEAWLTGPSFHYPVSLDARGAWVYHGSVPVECELLPGTQDAPAFDCGGVRWSYRDGSYGPRRLDGVVAFTSTKKSVVPLLVKVADEQAFKGWLIDRGVSEPVHYLLCEGFVPGAPAQVLTEGGAMRRLSKGCLSEIRMEAEGVGSEAPKAVAFSAAGLAALRDDVAVHLSGGTDGKFLKGGEARLLSALETPGTRVLRGRVEFVAKSQDGDSVAPERAIPGSHALLRSEGTAFQPVIKAQLLSAGTAKLEGGGCVKLEVTTHPWACSLLKACRGGSTFLEIDEVGCGARKPVLRAAYNAGTVRGKSDSVEVVAVIDAMGESTRTDVLRTELYIRPKQP